MLKEVRQLKHDSKIQDPLLAFSTDKSERTPLHMVCSMYKNPKFKQVLEDHMKKINPSFFEKFDPRHRYHFNISGLTHDRVDHGLHLVPSSLTEEQKASLLDKDVSVSKIAENVRSGKYKKIVFLTGAGISTSSGIADFVCLHGVHFSLL